MSVSLSKAARIDAARPLRILLVTEACGGGAGRHVLDLAEGLDSRGHAVVVAYSPVRAENSFMERLRSLPVLSLEVGMHRAIGADDLMALARLRRIYREYGPFDVIHGHSSKAGALIRLLPGRMAKFYTPHAFRTMDPSCPPLKKATFAALERLLSCRPGHSIIAVSSDEATHASTYLRLPSAKLHTVVNGVDPVSQSPPSELRESWDVPRDAFIMGFVGRLTAQKNPLAFVRSLSSAATLNPNIFGVMLGDGELKSAVYAEASRLGVAQRLRLFSGMDARPLLSAFDCLVVTSDYEAMPYVFLESLSAGLPIISLPVGGTNEAVDHGKTGYLVEEHQISDVVHTLSRDNLLMKRLSIASSQRAERYRLTRMIEQTERLYVREVWPSHQTTEAPENQTVLKGSIRDRQSKEAVA